MSTVTIYTGSTPLDTDLAEALQEWSDRQPNVQLIYESIHDNPAAAVCLGITDLPALVVYDELIAQGPPRYWLTDALFAKLSTRLNTEG